MTTCDYCNDELVGLPGIDYYDFFEDRMYCDKCMNPSKYANVKKITKSGSASKLEKLRDELSRHIDPSCSEKSGRETPEKCTGHQTETENLKTTQSITLFDDFPDIPSTTISPKRNCNEFQLDNSGDFTKIIRRQKRSRNLREMLNNEKRNPIELEINIFRICK